MGDIRPGASMFSLRDGVITIPAIVLGSDRIIRNRILRFPRVRVVFGPPLEIPGVGAPRSERAAVATRRLIDALQSLLAAHAEQR